MHHLINYQEVEIDIEDGLCGQIEAGLHEGVEDQFDECEDEHE